MQQIPVLISIPHGGTNTPPELIDRTCILPEDIFDDIDPFTREIYDLEPWVVEVMDTDIARAFVDLNRAPDDFPPKNPDGIIKSMTCYKKPIYIKEKEPDEPLIQTLIDGYYLPYHRKIQEITSQNKELKLALDCHSMAVESPPISPDHTNKKFLQGGQKREAGKLGSWEAAKAGRVERKNYQLPMKKESRKQMLVEASVKEKLLRGVQGGGILEKSPPGRPIICLGDAHGKACSQEMVEKLARCFCEAFQLEEKDITINQPFAGGYITRTYGNNPLPWVQVEMNRSLYLADPWFDPITLQVDNHRLMELNDRFKKTLELYFKNQSNT
jgi:N-formylglutamate amidohydrolase